MAHGGCRLASGCIPDGQATPKAVRFKVLQQRRIAADDVERHAQAVVPPRDARRLVIAHQHKQVVRVSLFTDKVRQHAQLVVDGEPVSRAPRGVVDRFCRVVLAPFDELRGQG